MAMSTEIITKKYSIAEFLALPKDGKRYELLDGELIEMPGASEEHVRISSNIQHYLSVFVRQNNLGIVYGSDARYAIVPGKDTVRMADVSFIQSSRVRRGVAAMNFGPDLAVEVLSDSNTYQEIEDKVAQYFNAGGKLAWVANPDKQEVYVYRAGSNQRQTLTTGDELDGEKVLPGFTLEVAKVFE